MIVSHLVLRCFVALLAPAMSVGAIVPTTAVTTGIARAAAATTATAGPVDARRLAGDNRYGTAAAIAADGWGRANAVVIADGGVATDALVGAHLAARLDAPLLLSVDSGQGEAGQGEAGQGEAGQDEAGQDGAGGETAAPAETVEAMQLLSPQTIYVVNGAVVPPTADQRVDRVPITGDSPAALAAAALEVVPGDPAMPLIVASSATFADALSAANLAPARLLFTAADRLDAASATAIDELDPAEVWVMGGSAAIGESVSDQIEGLGPAVRRVSGPNRYATSVAAARLAMDVAGPASPPDQAAALVSGQNWPDALAIVPWAAGGAAAVFLTTHRELPAEIIDELSARGGDISEVVVGGGTVAVGNYVDEQAVALLRGTPQPGANAIVRSLREDEQSAMTGVSWRPGCPVELADLRVVEARYFHLDGTVRPDGQLIVHRDVADDVAAVMHDLFAARFPIVRMEPVRNFAADDVASMDADNTSAFNCRTVAGTSRWSEHAYGTAIDINPIENPYVSDSIVVPEAGRAFVDRTDVRPGMILRDGPVVAAFASIGWGWGADFTSSADYQHFSRSGG